MRTRSPEMTSFLPYWLGEQERSYSCGAAALKYALCTLGFSKNEAHLRRLAKTNWHGTDDAKFSSTASRFGCDVEKKIFAVDRFASAEGWLHKHLERGHP